MSNSEDWNKLSDIEKQRRIDDLKKFISEEFEREMNWLGKMMQERPADLHNFVFIHGRLPLKDDDGYFL